MTLKEYVMRGRKTIPRGAVARVAEKLRVSREQAVRLIGGLSVSQELSRLAQDFVASRASFSSHKPGKKTSFDPRDVLAMRAEGKTFRAIGKALGISHETARKIVRKAVNSKDFSVRKSLICFRTTQAVKNNCKKMLPN